MTRIGFIGLGLMGNPMSKNLVNAGHQLTVWNRTEARTDELVASGAQRGTSPANVAAVSEITITIVSDSTDVETVILGDDGVLAGAQSGTVVVDMSTISPSVTRIIAARLKENDVDMLDAPVSGGVAGAVQGTLSVMVGGEKLIFERCLPVLEVMGGSIAYCGGNGMGQVTKLANQIVGLGTLAAVCEGLVFAAKAGADPDALLQALGGGAANSWMVENMGPNIFNGEFAPGFMVDLAQKDLRLVLETASEMDVPLLTTALVNQGFKAAQRAGHGRLGIQAYVKVLECLAGIETRRL